jgi:hypothetical protein
MTMQEKMMRIVLINPVVPVDPDRSADPVRSGAAPTPVRNDDLSGCVAADRVNEDVGGGRHHSDVDPFAPVDPDRSDAVERQFPYD